MLTSKERLLKVLKGEEPDRIPWAPLIDGYYTSSLPEQGLHMDVVETLRYIGADILERHVGVVRSHVENLHIRTIQEGNKIIEFFETPVGSITQERTISGKTSFISKYLITNERDAIIYKYIVEHTKYEPDYDNFLKEQEYIGDSGLATASGPLTPIQSLLQHLMGIEAFTYGLIDYGDILLDLMDSMHKSNIECYKLMAKSPAKVIIVYEDTSTTVMSPTWFKNYCRDYLNQYSDIVHENNKLYIVHMCGKLKGMRFEIAKLSADGIDSVCPPTTGDTYAYEALEWWPNKVIIGGIEPPALKRMNVQETEKYVLEILKRTGKGDRFILSTGDATSYGTPIENLKAVTRIVEEYGKYPLNV